MIKKVLIVFAFILVAGIGLLLVLARSHPDLSEYSDLAIPASAENAAAPIKIQFLGVSTILISDGKHSILTDGFFSRPGLWTVLFSDIGPDEARVRQSLAKAGIHKVDVIVPVHSHYDHAMDSPLVARLTGARLLGSETSLQIARGQGLSEAQMERVEPGKIYTVGDFKLQVLPSRHSPNPVSPGTLDHPLQVPASYKEYAMGQCYSVLIEHSGKRILIQGSAGFEPGVLKGVKADVVFLGIGALGKQTDEYRQRYWEEVVSTTQPSRIILIHWDDFWRPLSEPLLPLPPLMDDFGATMDFLREHASKSGIDRRIPAGFQSFDPFFRPQE